MRKFIASLFSRDLKIKHEVEVMYFGRLSDFLMMTSERIVILDEPFTLRQMLNELCARGERWAYELDENYVMCTVNQESAMLSDSIKVGDEIGIFSRKSDFEM
jgi:molybdopterin converting factor small subunit